MVAVGVSLLAAIIGYFVLMIIGTNLTGFTVRGIVQPERDDKGDVLAASIFITAFFLVIVILYCALLANLFNAGVLIAGLIPMITRIPDLLWEIRTGARITRQSMPKRPIDLVCALLDWAAFPILWYSLWVYFR